MQVIVGADHRGFYLKQQLVDYLNNGNYEVIDEGDDRLNLDDDFPVFAQKAVHKLLQSSDADARAILLCGSGQGMCMAANRFKGVRACLGYDTSSARSSRNDDNANVLCVPADNFKNSKKLFSLIDVFLQTPFSDSPRFKRRIQEIDNF